MIFISHPNSWYPKAVPQGRPSSCDMLYRWSVAGCSFPFFSSGITNHCPWPLQAKGFQPTRCHVDLLFVSGIQMPTFSLFLVSSKECAKAFHAAGSRLVLCGRDSEKLKDLAQELSAMTDHRKNVSAWGGKARCPTQLGLVSVLAQKLELARVLFFEQ